MTNHEGLVVELEVERNIPYLRSGSAFAQPRPPRETKVVAISPMVEAPCLVGKEAEPSEEPEQHGEEAEELELDEDEHANSEELDAILPDGDATPEIVSGDEGEHREEASSGS